MTGVIFPSPTPPSCWIAVLLLFLSRVASFFAADLLGLCPQSQAAAWLFLGKLVIDFHLRRKAEASLSLSLMVEFWEHACFSSVSSVPSFQCWLHFTAIFYFYFLNDLGLLSAYLTASACGFYLLIELASSHRSSLCLTLPSSCLPPPPAPVVPEQLTPSLSLTANGNQTSNLRLRTREKCVLERATSCYRSVVFRA